MSRFLIKKLLRREKRKMKFKVGDKVKIHAKNRVHQPVLDLHDTIQEIEAVFGGATPYRVKGYVFLFKEEELELVKLSQDSAIEKANNIVPIIPAEVKSYYPPYKAVPTIDYMSLISGI